MSTSNMEMEAYHDPLAAGQQALARRAWDEARGLFEEALRRLETPEALEGLGMAAWWQHNAPTMFDARERAYLLYRQRRDSQAAARMAILLALDHTDFQGDSAVAKGWLQRAHRLLEGMDRAPERGWLAIWEGLWSLPDTGTARKLGREAAALGRSLGLVDIEMAGVALEGLALVSEGMVAEGMPRLDEATAAAVAGELTDLAVMGLVCCLLIYACELVRDYDRAAQWCDTMEELCKRWGIRHLFAFCHTHYAGVLLWRGAWAEAESELASATEELKRTRPAMAVEGIVRLAELRRRQGQLEAAKTLFSQVEFHSLAKTGLAALALDQGDAASAADLAQRYLRTIPHEDRTERAAGLELLVRAEIALGNPERAATSLAELQSIAGVIATDPLKAAANFAEAIVAAANKDYRTAQGRLEDAIDLFERSGAPFETARTRIDLAGVLRALGRSGAAQQEAQKALEALLSLGAEHELRRARTALQEIASTTHIRPGKTAITAGLTRRETEVLRLVAQGMSNQEIAHHLVLSQHTVHRHMANILNKLNLPSRAAAATYAAQRGLV